MNAAVDRAQARKAEAATRPLGLGVLIPDFKGATVEGAPFVMHRIAGEPTLLALGGDYGRPGAQAAFRALQGDDRLRDAPVQVVGAAVRDGEGLAERERPNVALIADRDGAFCRGLGVLGDDGRFAPCLMLLDATLRVLAVFPESEVSAAAEAALDAAGAWKALQPDLFAPVLTVPRVFEPELCRTLIALYRREGGESSGFMREVDGKTVVVNDPTHKRRADLGIEDAGLRQALQGRIQARLVPSIKRAFSFQATRMERYIVACYAARDSGFFRRHRDNTTLGTAHRRFAVTINLNAEEYEGGDLRFPEFGPRRYRAPTGGAVVFGCDLLHEVEPVTRGERFAFLPFLYDEAGAKVREQNSHALSDPALRYAAAS